MLSRLRQCRKAETADATSTTVPSVLDFRRTLRLLNLDASVAYLLVRSRRNSGRLRESAPHGLGLRRLGDGPGCTGPNGRISDNLDQAKPRRVQDLFRQATMAMASDTDGAHLAPRLAGERAHRMYRLVQGRSRLSDAHR
jgi:hypothetical protein